MWKLGYTLSTGMEFKRKYGLEYEVLMKHEHVNTAKEIEEVLNYFLPTSRTAFSAWRRLYLLPVLRLQGSEV